MPAPATVMAGRSWDRLGRRIRARLWPQPGQRTAVCPSRRALPTKNRLALWSTSWGDVIVRPASLGYAGYEKDEPDDNTLLYVWHGVIVPSVLYERGSISM